MPIALCPKHSFGRIKVIESKMQNGKIFIKTMANDFVLPPHIENIQGAYFNKLNNRWIGEYKIKKICDSYWADQESSSIIQTGNGVISYKKQFKRLEDEKIDKRTKEYRDSKEETPIIIPEAIQHEVIEPEIINNKPTFTE